MRYAVGRGSSGTGTCLAVARVACSVLQQTSRRESRGRSPNRFGRTGDDGSLFIFAPHSSGTVGTAALSRASLWKSKGTPVACSYISTVMADVPNFSIVGRVCSQHVLVKGWPSESVRPQTVDCTCSRGSRSQRQRHVGTPPSRSESVSESAPAVAPPVVKRQLAVAGDFDNEHTQATSRRDRHSTCEREREEGQGQGQRRDRERRDGHGRTRRQRR